MPFNGYYMNYPDVNEDITLHKKVVKQVWSKLSDKWIFNYTKVFKFIKKSNDSFKLVDSMDEAENNSVSDKLEEKADWFLTNIYKKSNLASTIDKFRKKASMNWWNIPDNMERLNAFIYHQMRRMLLTKYIEQ